MWLVPACQSWLQIQWFVIMLVFSLHLLLLHLRSVIFTFPSRADWSSKQSLLWLGSVRKESELQKELERQGDRLSKQTRNQRDKGPVSLEGKLQLDPPSPWHWQWNYCIIHSCDLSVALIGEHIVSPALCGEAGGEHVVSHVLCGEAGGFTPLNEWSWQGELLSEWLFITLQSRKIPHLVLMKYLKLMNSFEPDCWFENLVHDRQTISLIWVE